MEEEKLRLKKGDYFILLFVLVVTVVLMFLVSNHKQGNYVHITADGITKTYSLFTEEMISFSGGKWDLSDTYTNITNTVVIEDGYVYMKNANCKDQICVNHKPISKHGEMIICLPNGVFVEVESNTANEIDN